MTTITVVKKLTAKQAVDLPGELGSAFYGPIEQNKLLPVPG
jgi:hypothetical protein